MEQPYLHVYNKNGKLNGAGLENMESNRLFPGTEKNHRKPVVRPALWSLFWCFFKIGSTAFGGFMALIAVVQNEMVENRKLIKHEDMLDGISLATILPGPVAVNVVAYVGYKLRGGLGALVSAVAVLLPAFILIVLLTIAYFRWGQMPTVNKLFMGFIPAVTAIIFSAAWGMARKTITGWYEAGIAVASGTLLLWIGGFYITLIIIFSSGLIGWIWLRDDITFDKGVRRANKNNKKTGKSKSRRGGKSLLLNLASVDVLPFLSMDFGILTTLFLTFAGMSVMLFGGAYVFIPLIQGIVVDNHRWVTQQEFIDAIAMGQITPGPILISAAFIGYKVAGLLGSVVATIGIYLPPALLMIAGTHALERLQRSIAIKSLLRGIRPAVIGMIFAAAVVMGLAASPNWVSILILAASLVALLRWQTEVIWIIPISGVAGFLLY
jgi:chromate transporter